MVREITASIAGNHADPLYLQSSGDIISFLCMIFMSFSIISFVIFACIGHGHASRKRRGGGGGGAGCGGGGAGCRGGSGCGGGGCGGGGGA